MKLREFQETAVNRALKYVRDLLNENDEDGVAKKMVFKSPTGSGKTVMMAELLRRLGEETETTGKFVYVWAAPNKLHSQSLEKLAGILRDTKYDLVDINSLEAGELAENTVLFTNWERVFTRATKDNEEKDIKKGDWTNKAARLGEDGRNLQDVLSATKAAGLKLVLIVDESHQTFYGANSQLFTNEIIKPTLTIEVSATPELRGQDRKVEVDMKDVIDSGLIKKEIRVNPDISDSVSEERDSLTTIVEAALARRETLRAEYTALDKDINPLVLIQLPSEKETLSDLDKRDREMVEEILERNGITYGNGKLAVWLSGEKINLDTITRSHDGVEVLIFKQAIALGWDCPRAGVLVMLRDIKSEKFKIQTVGRILRMPEALHYENDMLNAGFVYTDMGELSVERDDTDAQNLIKLYKTERKEGIENVNLPSVFMHRSDYGDIKASVAEILENVLDQTFGIDGSETEKECYDKIDEKLEVYDEELRRPIISNALIKNLDDELSLKVDTVDIKIDDLSIERKFDIVLRGLMLPYKNFARSRAIVFPILRKWFARGGFDELAVYRIFACSEKNQEVFRQVFDLVLDQYDTVNRVEMLERRKRERKSTVFNVPESDEYSENYDWVDMKKNALTKFYRFKDASFVEKKFEEFLDGSDTVVWWYKNGEKMERYLAIPYTAINELAKTYGASFYPDYIVKFADGRIGVYETKAGDSANPTATIGKNVDKKANALHAYLKEYNLVGGIVVPRSDRYDGFLIQNEEKYEFDNSDKWHELVL